MTAPAARHVRSGTDSEPYGDDNDLDLVFPERRTSRSRNRGGRRSGADATSTTVTGRRMKRPPT